MIRSKSNILIVLILLAIAGVVASNYIEQYTKDQSKLPEKVVESKGFLRWLTNHKKRMELSADEFVYKKKSEVYSADFLEVTRFDISENLEEHMVFVATYDKFNDVAVSPSERQFLDFRREDRDGYSPTEVRYYGLRDDKLIDTKILICQAAANCYFDRAYFVDNDSFVISEISRNIHKNDLENAPLCEIDEVCTYTFKLHFIDLINNTRLVFESDTFDTNLSEMVQFF